MGSTFGGLNTLVRGIYAQQVGLDTVGHNISNANTDGYSRQTVNLATSSTENVYGSRGMMQLGTGVTVESIMRARDTFVDRQMWKETSTLGYGQIMQDTLGKIEGVFQEPTDTGIQTVLNNFWSSLQTLATNASDAGARATVRQRGVEVVNAINHGVQQLKDMAADINSVIDIKIAKINQITSEIYSLNRQICNIEVGGIDHANDLRDRRDLLVDQLATMVNVTVNEDKYGNYSIQTAGITLVDGSGNTELRTEKSIQSYYGYEVKNVYAAGATQPLQFKSGELKGLIETRDSDINGVKGYLDKLDTISKFFLQDFNAVHRAGYGMDNSTNTNFFGDDGVDYETISAPIGGWITALKVNPALFNSADGLAKIAAKTAANSIAVTQSNTAGGAATVTATGLYTGGTSATSVQVKIDDVTAGAITGVRYSTDGGKTWSALMTGAGPYTFTVNGLNVNLDIAASAGNAKDDVYTFALSEGNNASGDNAILLSNRLKIDTRPNLGSASLDTYYSAVIAGLGVQAQEAERLTDNQKTLVSQIRNWRESTAGVNMDEEMTNMIRFQKGYNAAARVITTMDEMLDKLINGTGVVGR